MGDSTGYRVPDVCKLVGISYRQLDYWARTGLVTPSIREAGGSGTQRLYSFRDLVALRVVKSLLDGGMSLQRVRRAWEFLNRTAGLDEHLAEVKLVTDGKTIFKVVRRENEATDALR